MKISTEKMLDGVICGIQEGPVNSDVFIRLSDGKTMTAVMTRSSVKKLGLSVGKPLFRFASLVNNKKVVR
jgi:molybdate transport system regulatory protein